MKSIIKKVIPEKVYIFIWRMFHGNFNYLYKLIPVKKNRVCIINYYGKGFGDSGKYIVNEMLNQNVDNIEFVWLVKDFEEENNFPKEVKVVRYNRLNILYYLSSSKVWIDNCRKFIFPPKKKNQYYIQTWHGNTALKKVEKDAGNKLTDFYISMSKIDATLTDLMISVGEKNTELFLNSFWYDGEIAEIGLPRIDPIVNGNVEDKNIIKKKLGIGSSKVVLYAPTFRQDMKTDIFKLDFNRIIKEFNRKFNEDFIILIRLHPNISNRDFLIDYNDKIVDATKYDDMQELLMISDVLITDYSSSMFEFSLTRRPVFLLVPDYEKYKEERGTYFELEELPFVISYSEDDMFKNIEKFDFDVYKSNLVVFNNKLGLVKPGEASKEVVKIIKENILKS